MKIAFCVLLPYTKQFSGSALNALLKNIFEEKRQADLRKKSKKREKVE